ncbi:MAG TPA: restriction endonuclease subunit S [Bacteroidia bacterium]|nr:restriction endonuclease subunit S [Bacteroidia bacterium]
MRIELLKDIAEIIAGQSPPSATYNRSGEGMPFFQGMADYGDKFPVIRIWCSHPKKVSLPNDILISVRAPVGPVNVNNVEACIGRGLSAIRAKENYSHEYLYYFLKANKQEIANLGVGSTFTAITQKELGKIKISIPETLAEQIKIATILSKAEALTTQRKENIELLDNFLKSTFLKMFGDPVSNEHNLEKVELKYFGKIVTGNTPSRSNKENYSSNFIEWVKTDNISSESTFITKAFEYLSKEGMKNARTVTNGALLVACIAGSIESIGRAALSNRTVSFNQQINAIQPNEDISPWYLYWLFKVSRKYIQNHATKGMKRILTKGEFEKIKMIKPPFEAQKMFATIAENAEVIKEQLKSSLNDLENLYNSLSQRAFKGELDLSALVLMYEEEYSSADNDREEKKPIDKEKTTVELKKDGEPEDKRYTDLFEVDEATAEKQGKKFYKKWKRFHSKKKKVKLDWEKVSTEQAANWIKENYTGYHFTTEMLIQFLKDEHITFPDYFSSEELKKNPQANEADDLKSLIFSAVSKENPFLKLEQLFYNGVDENFELKITEEDYEHIKHLLPKERSGIYFSIIE